MPEIRPIHAFSDNFIWLLSNPDNRQAAVVDPGDAAPVLNALREQGLTLSAILITHKHSDHVGGITELLSAWPGIPVYGPAGEPISQLSHRLREGDQVDLPGLNARFEVLEIPGHTEGHIAYYRAGGQSQPGQPNQPNQPNQLVQSDAQPGSDGTLFCGDTLFSVGCGRVFSGSFDQLHDSLMRINALPGSTQCYCAHEYTLDNIGFAKWVEPNNPALAAREQHCHALLSAGHNSVPMLLADEQACNPFLRLQQADVIAAAERHAGRPMRDSRDSFHTLRSWKDSEYD